MSVFFFELEFSTCTEEFHVDKRRTFSASPQGCWVSFFSLEYCTLRRDVSGVLKGQDLRAKRISRPRYVDSMDSEGDGGAARLDTGPYALAGAPAGQRQ